MFKKVLVALDGSDHAGKALDLAVELARTSKAAITILNVASDKPLTQGEAQLARAEFRSEVGQALNVPQFIQDSANTTTTDALTQASQSAGLAVRQSIGQRLVEMGAAEAKRKGVSPISTRVEVGDSAAAILAVADEEKSDFIVMGTRGLGSIKGLLLGSVSHKVVQLAHCSVITVK
jgi:nucleotide-binding universal stress UspA family protein